MGVTGTATSEPVAQPETVMEISVALARRAMAMAMAMAMAPVASLQ
jgi:hypothetical protein